MKDFCTIVIGYDNYSDVWSYFSFFYSKNWQKNLPRTFFVSIEKRGPSCFHTILSHSASASSRIKAGITSCSSDYILLLLEDYIVSAKVDDSIIKSIVETMEQKSLDYVCLQNFITPLRGKTTFRQNDLAYGALPLERNYRINLQPSIWKKSFLLKIINKGMNNLWDIENYLNNNKEEFKNIPAVFPKKKIINIVNFIDKGKYSRKAIHIIKRNNLAMPKRPVLSRFSTLKINIKNWIIGLIPPKLLSKIMCHKNNR